MSEGISMHIISCMFHLYSIPQPFHIYKFKKGKLIYSSLQSFSV